jgi:hypothetical protein
MISVVLIRLLTQLLISNFNLKYYSTTIRDISFISVFAVAVEEISCQIGYIQYKFITVSVRIVDLSGYLLT